jgi:hypothetical protein
LKKLYYVKKIITKIDTLILGSILQKRYGHYLAVKMQTKIASGFDNKIVIYYQKNLNCEFSKLCDVYGSDKGELQSSGHPYPWPSHSYADFYTRLFSHCRNSIKNVFECGLGTNNPDLPSSMGISGKPGASLRVWRDYFPNAMVYGADIDKDVLFQENRIETYFIDQLDPVAIQNFWKKINKDGFDLIVDDGLHTFEAGLTLFVNSISRLANDGIYIIEDVSSSDLIAYKQFFAEKEFLVDYVHLYRPGISLNDNSLVVVRKTT